MTNMSKNPKKKKNRACVILLMITIEYLCARVSSNDYSKNA